MAGGDCVSSCLAGETGGAGVCEPCAPGTYKPDQGAQACAPCPAPTSASLEGSTLAAECMCPAGFLDNRGTEYVYVASVGGLSESGVSSAAICAGVGNGVPCAVLASQSHRLRSLVLTPGAGATLRNVTVQVSHLGTVLTLFLCTSDCVLGATVLLEGLPGALFVTVTNAAQVVLARHTRRTASLAPAPSLFTLAQVEQAVLRDGLRAGDALWAPAEGGAVACVVCLQCLACL